MSEKQETLRLGLKRGTVALEPHRAEWETAARETARLLKACLGEDAVDIQHVGSTAIRGIPAKPILDLAVGLTDLQCLPRHDRALADAGFIFRGEDVPGELLYVVGTADSRSHHIHMVPYGGKAWTDYITFRDHLNANPEAAQAYARLKEQLAAQYPDDRAAYTAGKQPLIQSILQAARRT